MQGGHLEVQGFFLACGMGFSALRATTHGGASEDVGKCVRQGRLSCCEFKANCKVAGCEFAAFILLLFSVARLRSAWFFAFYIEQVPLVELLVKLK